MAVRHYRLDYSTDDGSTWTTAVVDEIPGPNKTVSLASLPPATYSVKLRLMPLDAGYSPTISNSVVVNLGNAPIQETPIAVASAVVTLSDLLTLQEKLLAASNVQLSAGDIQQLQDALIAEVTGLPSVADVQVLIDQLRSDIEVLVSATDAFCTNLQTDINAIASAMDVFSGSDNAQSDASTVVTVSDIASMVDVLQTDISTVISSADIAGKLENLEADASAVVTATEIQAMVDNVAANASALAAVLDGLVKSDSVEAGISAVVSITNIQSMVEQTLATITAQATQTDGQTMKENITTAAQSVTSSNDEFSAGASFEPNTGFESGTFEGYSGPNAAIGNTPVHSGSYSFSSYDTGLVEGEYGLSLNKIVHLKAGTGSVWLYKDNTYVNNYSQAKIFFNGAIVGIGNLVLDSWTQLSFTIPSEMTANFVILIPSDSYGEGADNFIVIDDIVYPS